MNENQRKICTEIWQEYESQLRKICKIKLQSHPNEIDDVMSEVSLALCKQIKKYGEPNKPKQWLYATLNNIINLKYRELYKFKEKQESLENNDFELPFEENGIESKIEEIYNNEIRDKLSTFLSNDEYIIIKYIYFDRLKMKEIADIIGSTESAVKQKHYRICNKLRKLAKKFEKNYWNCVTFSIYRTT